MIYNLQKPEELKDINILLYYEYGDVEGDFFKQPFSLGDQDIKVKYFNNQKDAEELFHDMCYLLPTSSVDQRVVVILTEKDNKYIVGLIEEDQFSIWFDDQHLSITWDIDISHMDIYEWIKLF